MRKRNRIQIAPVVVGLFLSFLSVDIQAQTERILSFRSDIDLHQDGSMTVTETITVICAGEEIQRGIFRTFPTQYRDRYGNRMRVAFDVKEVLKNGEPEPYHIENASNGVIVYFGSSDVLLPHGKYTYTLVYGTDRQIGFFDGFDELYWNVTGLDWGFIIDHAEAVIHLPPGADAMDTAGYTGPQGAQGQNYSVRSDDTGAIRFSTTQSLLPREGLTVVVSFTKGIIPEPGLLDKIAYILKDNPGTVAALIGLCVLLAYYIIAWTKVGKDPSKGTIVPLFHPPTGYSPAATRFVMRMGYSDRIFAAAIVNMAVKGYVSIQELKEKYTLVRTKTDESALDKGERQIAEKLFSSGKKIELEQKNHQQIQSAIQALKKSLRLNFEKMNFKRNGIYALPGILFTLAILLVVVIFAPVREGAIFIVIWLSGWTAGTFFLVMNALKEWKSLLSGDGFRAGRGAGVIVSTLFALPFLGFELVGLWMFSAMMSPWASLALLVLIFINALFFELLKAPTLYGRKVMDQIEGFKMYMETAEEERLKILHPPKKTPELFEKYLPYALALNVENAWIKKFANVLARAGENSYSPVWYSGRSWSAIGSAGLVSSLGSSFSSAIS
ncbi:DUF2207 domain-containing protein, partial [bacterium]|nr:DUF2207 domain-containing protein [bacterium]